MAILCMLLIVAAALASVANASVLTPYGCTCTGSCTDEGERYSWCYVNGCQHNWDYCSPNTTQRTPYGCTCTSTCENTDAHVDYTWCYVTDCVHTWDYCETYAHPAETGPTPLKSNKAAGTVTLDIKQVQVEVPKCGSCAGSKTQFSQSQAQKMLNLHNDMRCATGAGPLTWNCSLQCQVQEWADKCSFAHSDSFSSPIPAGENLASGTDIDTAAWMWFTEYSMGTPHSSDQDQVHFTAMTWKDTTQMACGICVNSSSPYGGLIFCQYANQPPNLDLSSKGPYNLDDDFTGTEEDFAKCPAIGTEVFGFEAAKQQITRFTEWGLLSDYDSSATGLPARPVGFSSTLYLGGFAALSVSVAMLMLYKRWSRQQISKQRWHIEAEMLCEEDAPCE